MWIPALSAIGAGFAIGLAAIGSGVGQAGRGLEGNILGLLRIRVFGFFRVYREGLWFMGLGPLDSRGFGISWERVPGLRVWGFERSASA